MLIFLTAVAILPGCHDSRQAEADRTGRSPALRDTLVAIFEAIGESVAGRQAEDISDLLVAAEAERLGQIGRRYGASSLGWCLERQLGFWPNLDTLDFEDLVHRPPYARIAMSGAGSYARYREGRVRYTFLLFRYEAESWRLAGVSSLEKERYDPYGTELSYFETELPPQLRFPRLF